MYVLFHFVESSCLKFFFLSNFFFTMFLILFVVHFIFLSPISRVYIQAVTSLTDFYYSPIRNDTISLNHFDQNIMPFGKCKYNFINFT